MIGREETPAWMAQGLCAQVDPEIFFPEAGHGMAAAKRICLACTVRTDCLAYAEAHGIVYGVWGGLGERERKAARVARKQVAA